MLPDTRARSQNLVRLLLYIACSGKPLLHDLSIGIFNRAPSHSHAGVLVLFHRCYAIECSCLHLTALDPDT